MKVKSEAKEIFIKFQVFVEKQFNCKIKTLQIDWGGEFRSLLPVLNQLGIHFQHPCPHVHEQNGKVERKHRHIVETGLTLLAQTAMSLKDWWAAFASAVHLINRLPTPVLHMTSPFEAVYHRKPNYTQLRVFGSICFPCLRPYNKHKLQYKPSKCGFLGYSLSHKGYRCLHSSGRIYLARHVIFNENEFPYCSLFPGNSSSPCFDLVQPVLRGCSNVDSAQFIPCGGLFHFLKIQSQKVKPLICLFHHITMYLILSIYLLCQHVIFVLHCHLIQLSHQTSLVDKASLVMIKTRLFFPMIKQYIQTQLDITRSHQQ